MITPKEAKARRHASHPEALLNHEQLIDTLLASAPNPTDKRWWSSVHNTSPDLIEALIQRYTAGGWQVDVIHDWRDGDVLMFEAKKEKA